MGPPLIFYIIYIAFILLLFIYLFHKFHSDFSKNILGLVVAALGIELGAS